MRALETRGVAGQLLSRRLRREAWGDRLVRGETGKVFMGEMADFINDNEWAIDDPYEPPPTVTCRYCKRDRFHWLETEDGWRLVTATGKVHRCKDYKHRD